LIDDDDDEHVTKRGRLTRPFVLLLSLLGRRNCNH